MEPTDGRVLMPKQLRISGDLSGHSVVLVTDDGEVLTNVTHATVELDANDWNRVTLEVVGIEINLSAAASGCTFVCPVCSHSEEHKCSDALSPSPVTPTTQNL